MDFVLIVTSLLALAFIGIGVVCALVAFLSRRGDLPFLSPLGLRIPEVRTSPQAWRKAHASVWPLFALAGAMSVFHGLALIPASLMRDVGAGGYVAVVAIAGLVVLVALWVLVGKAARAALDT